MKFKKFHAEWCGPCKVVNIMLDTMVEDGIKIPELESINIDVDKDLVTKYNIRGIPTIIRTNDDGEELERLTGMISAKQLKEFLNVA